MRNYEADQYVRGNRPTVAMLRTMVDEAHTEGMSRVNVSLTRKQCLDIMRGALEAVEGKYGPDHKMDMTTGHFLIARNIVWECSGKARFPSAADIRAKLDEAGSSCVMG